MTQRSPSSLVSVENPIALVGKREISRYRLEWPILRFQLVKGVRSYMAANFRPIGVTSVQIRGDRRFAATSIDIPLKWNDPLRRRESRARARIPDSRRLLLARDFRNVLEMRRARKIHQAPRDDQYLHSCIGVRSARRLRAKIFYFPRFDYFLSPSRGRSRGRPARIINDLIRRATEARIPSII